MIVIGVVLAIALLGAYVFLGFKISESIVNPDIRTFFWGLYFVTLITLFNIVLSIYFYVSVSDKTGPIGPMGRKGKQGERGDAGVCEEDCKVKTVRLLIEKTIEELAKKPLNAKARDHICEFMETEQSGGSGSKNKNIIKSSFTFAHLEALKEYYDGLISDRATNKNNAITFAKGITPVSNNIFIGNPAINTINSALSPPINIVVPNRYSGTASC